MLILIGAFIVLASTLGGFMLAGGQPLVLLHVSEFVVILGVALGVASVVCITTFATSVLGKNRAR